MSTIRWGVLGTSGVAREFFIPAIAQAGNSEPLMIGSRSQQRAREVADELAVPKAGTYEEVIDNPDVDAVYISLPNTLHRPWILRALEAGKPVLCEKPLTVDAAEAEEVHAKSQQTGLPVMEGLMYRFHPQNLRVRELLTSGAIGEVTEVRVHNGFRLIDFIKPDNIRVTDGPGAGALMDMGCYVVSASRMLYGAEPVDARGWMDHDDALGTDVGFAGTLEYPGRRFAQVSWSFRTGYGAGYVVVGTESTLEVPRAFIPGAVEQVEETLIITHDRCSRRFEEKIAPANHFRLMIESFADSLIQGTRPVYDSADALGNAKALDLVRKAGAASAK